MVAGEVGQLDLVPLLPRPQVSRIFSHRKLVTSVDNIYLSNPSCQHPRGHFYTTSIRDEGVSYNFGLSFVNITVCERHRGDMCQREEMRVVITGRMRELLMI